jgi:DNA (cytosine-5)-methyltransferase 1
MAWDEVAPTLTTGCTDVTRGRFAHPEDDRAITLREAALLQTFPPSYRFTGNGSEVAIQIGNAVPVRLISALAPVFKSLIEFAPDESVPTPEMGHRLGDCMNMALGAGPLAKMGSPE